MNSNYTVLAGGRYSEVVNCSGLTKLPSTLTSTSTTTNVYTIPSDRLATMCVSLTSTRLKISGLKKTSKELLVAWQSRVWTLKMWLASQHFGQQSEEDDEDEFWQTCFSIFSIVITSDVSDV